LACVANKNVFKKNLNIALNGNLLTGDLNFMTPDFVKVAQKTEITPGTTKAVKVQDKNVLLANVNGSFYAVAQKCTHMGGDLSKNLLEGTTITCPKHHAKFDITTGKVVSHPKMGLLHPKAKDLETYEVKVENDDILIKL
jgi:3-phenylpropionate/trans-cinnamate dioxygenase ferredoxin component